ncbi:hypothetical protein MUK71_08390 [Arthrobacter zhangbolii]|uniref:Uncharacterized protein n=1 Tax=Arthrobacter zhangbolii TaxID=2886936 RepID=A0A9X1M528_9MICC|nr:hypothetical protein [Arthrobacter zhangbolii]MCC3271563.1 hypothetical protein [Arthrobacter zhangbolii]UON90670.1 hypothetical protein MUK71_08390 [Arthrobacter zhangbolii]
MVSRFILPTPAPAVSEPAAAVGTPWWEVLGALGPLAVLAAATLTFIIGWKTLEQRRKADQRSEWWARAEWAIEASLSDDPRRQETGLGVLDLLAQSDLAGAEEAAIISIAWARPLTAIVDSNGGMGQNEDTTSVPGAEEVDDDNSSTAAGTRR